MTAFVLATNLGADIDVGVQVAGKLNVVAATTLVPGKMRFATATEFTNGAAGVVADASQVTSLVARLDPGVDNNLATNGTFGIGVGTVASTDLGLASTTLTQVSDLGLASTAVTTTIDLGLASA